MKSNPPFADPSRDADETRTSAAARKSPPTELAPGLYVTATPIGNARDITLRALDVLRSADLIVAEDTRVTAKLLAIHAVRRPLSAYNDHNAARERPRILSRLRSGARVALVSDAGTPLVSDPGYKLVGAAIDEGLPVHTVPGPSAALAGLVLSGLPPDRFLFAGFLPTRSGARRRVLEELVGARATLIFFESAQRLAETLSDMREVFGEREAAIARELTKLHEEIRRATLSILIEECARSAPPKGEVTLLVSGSQSGESDLAFLGPLLKSALAFMPLRAAVDLITAATKLSRSAVYDHALKAKSDAE
jgi:16S rRNA (cytidine1402-2'-O)-methyltransferase